MTRAGSSTPSVGHSERILEVGGRIVDHKEGTRIANANTRGDVVDTRSEDIVEDPTAVAETTIVRRWIGVPARWRYPSCSATISVLSAVLDIATRVTRARRPTRKLDQTTAVLPIHLDGRVMPDVARVQSRRALVA